MSGENNFFTLVWKIEDWETKFVSEFVSPEFTVEKFLNTTWCLELTTLHRDKFECALKRSESSEGPYEIKINFKIVLCDYPDKLINFENKQTEIFEKSSSSKLYNWSQQIWFRSCDFIYIICLMSLDTNEIQRHIFNNDKVLIPSILNLQLGTSNENKSVLDHFKGNLQELQEKYFRFSNSCFARTVVPVEKKKFVWSMDHIMNNYKNEYVFSAQKGICLSATSKLPDFLIEVHMNEENTISIIIRTKTNQSNGRSLFCKVWIADSDENVCCSEVYCSDKPNNFELILETNKILLENPEFDLKTCCLCLEIKIPNGDEFTWIESTSPACFPNINVPDNNQADYNLRTKMENMYKSKLFSDVILQLPQRKFDAHKAVLCNNSPVFRAMFENKMQENETNVAVIDDLDDDTMERMLKFMYSDTLDDIGFGETLKVYVAADKYQILPLQKKCSINLKSYISLENALELLSLSDAHSDKDLKSLICKFIVKHIKEIIVLEDWKLFCKSSVHLANEILEKVCKKLINLNV